jgi:hypothetical protein
LKDLGFEIALIDTVKDSYVVIEFCFCDNTTSVEKTASWDIKPCCCNNIFTGIYYISISAYKQ